MNENEIKNIVTKGYIDILNREPDYGGLEIYTNLIKKGMTIEKFHDILKSSDEYKKSIIPPLTITLDEYKKILDNNLLDNKQLKNKSNKITIICPTYKNLDYFSLFYESYILTKKSSKDIDLIVAINGNDIETKQFCITNNINYTIQEKLGMYSATNLASQKITDGYMMIVNDDIYLDELFFIELEPLLSPNAVLISKSIQPIVAGGTFRDFHNYGDSYDNFDKEGFLKYCKKVKTTDLKFHNFGVVYLIHKNNWFTVNGFDENFDPYGGGMADLMYRLYLSGIRNFWLMNNVLHYHFIRKCAIKHNLSRGDTDLQIFRHKWKKDFSDVDKIIRKGCTDYIHKNITKSVSKKCEQSSLK